MNNQKMLDVVTMIANIILPDKCDHESAVEIWLRAMQRKAREALESCEREHVGNAAAMREALREAIGETCAGCKRDCDDCMNLKSGWMKKAKVALSAPARNCDRFFNADQAVGAYRQTHKNMIVNVFLDWLFAPAAERKGDGDENK